jgi:hypothetical protein
VSPVAAVAADAAMLVLKGLIGHWVEQGKDPHTEAVRIAGLEGSIAAVDAELQAEIAKKPHRVPGTGE